MIMRFIYGKTKVAVTIVDGKFVELNSAKISVAGEPMDIKSLVKRTASSMKKIEQAAMAEYQARQAGKR